MTCGGPSCSRPRTDTDSKDAAVLASVSACLWASTYLKLVSNGSGAGPAICLLIQRSPPFPRPIASAGNVQQQTGLAGFPFVLALFRVGQI